MDIPLAIVLAVLGALLGSFGCAQVWRLRARQLVEDKVEYEQLKAHDKDVKRSDYYDPTELATLKRLIRPVRNDRSECLHCQHTLAWYDLIPIVSWLVLGGKCRYCHRSIGVTELFAEVGLAATYVISFVAWPYSLATVLDVAIFSIWLVLCLAMLILLIYDTKWSLLPFRLNISFVIVAAVFSVLAYTAYSWNIWSLLISIGLLSGLYALFAAFKWAGFGDSILGLGLALVLGRWQLAFLALFLANIFGCIMLIPLYVRRKLHRQLRVPFGPFLILGAFVALLWGQAIIHWYLSASGLLLTPLML